MGFIGVQPTSVPLTSSDITDGIISTAKIADDAVGNTKLDLSANYAFTGTLSGVGKVLQAITTADHTTYNTSSTSYVSSGQFLQITPSATTSKILLLYSSSCYNNTAGGFVISTIYRNITSSTDGATAISGGTDLSGRGTSGYGFAYQYSQTGTNIIPLSSHFLDSPSSTSQQTYVLAFKSIATGTSYWNSNNSEGTFTAMEIGA